MSSIIIPVQTSKTVQIKATKEGMTDSAIATYNYAVYDKVATPVITDEGSGQFSIACSTSGAAIYYTTNGDTPTTGSTLYSAPVTLEATATVKAKAFKTNWAASEVASQEIEAGEWTPADLANIDSWYEADSAYFTTGETNTTWVDKIGGAKTFSVANANAPALDDVNKKLTFDYSNSEMMERADDGLNGESNVSLVFIAKILGTTGAVQYLGGANFGSGKTHSLYIAANLQAILMTAGGTSFNDACSDTQIANNYRLYISNHINSGSSGFIAYACDAGAADCANTATGAAYNYGTYSTYLGRAPGASSGFLNAEIKAVLIVKGTITGDDLTNLKTYVKEHYGVSYA